jgi:DHA1 family bicyclomycin/chloramphenicol resistance-like MFS transporter
MVRDLYDRNQSARILSLNMLVTASAPVVAPLIGGQVLLWCDWRAIFWVLVGFGLVSLLAASALPETSALLGKIALRANPVFSNIHDEAIGVFINETIESLNLIWPL